MKFFSYYFSFIILIVKICLFINIRKALIAVHNFSFASTQCHILRKRSESIVTVLLTRTTWAINDVTIPFL